MCVCVKEHELFLERSSFFEGILESIFVEGPGRPLHLTSRGMSVLHAKREDAAASTSVCDSSCRSASAGRQLILPSACVCTDAHCADIDCSVFLLSPIALDSDGTTQKNYLKKNNMCTLSVKREIDLVLPLSLHRKTDLFTHWTNVSLQILSHR